jgi:hypothetical protein
MIYFRSSRALLSRAKLWNFWSKSYRDGFKSDKYYC